jgi:sugar/nucleoside kinase (ribokinase family)
MRSTLSAPGSGCWTWAPGSWSSRRGSALFLSREELYALPAFPLAEVVDPTGAGDSFAGGFMGYLASAGQTDAAALKRALAYGTVVASFNVEDFSLHRFQRTDRAEIDRRLETYRRMMTF